MKDRDFIFGMHTPLVMLFQMTPFYHKAKLNQQIHTTGIL